MGDRRVLRSANLRRAIAVERLRGNKLAAIASDRKKREAEMHKVLPVFRIEASQVLPVAFVPKERSLYASVPRRSLTKRVRHSRWSRK